MLWSSSDVVLWCVSFSRTKGIFFFSGLVLQSPDDDASGSQRCHHWGSCLKYKVYAKPEHLLRSDLAVSLSSKLESRLAVLVLRACSLGLVEERITWEALCACVLLHNRCGHLAVAQKIYSHVIRKVSQNATLSHSWWWFLTWLFFLLHNYYARRHSQLRDRWSHICFHNQERRFYTELQSGIRLSEWYRRLFAQKCLDLYINSLGLYGWLVVFVLTFWL